MKNFYRYSNEIRQNLIKNQRINKYLICKTMVVIIN